MTATGRMVINYFPLGIVGELTLNQPIFHANLRSSERELSQARPVHKKTIVASVGQDGIDRLATKIIFD